MTKRWLCYNVWPVLYGKSHIAMDIAFPWLGSAKLERNWCIMLKYVVSTHFCTETRVSVRLHMKIRIPIIPFLKVYEIDPWYEDCS